MALLVWQIFGWVSKFRRIIARQSTHSAPHRLIYIWIDAFYLYLFRRSRPGWCLLLCFSNTLMGMKDFVVQKTPKTANLHKKEENTNRWMENVSIGWSLAEEIFSFFWVSARDGRKKNKRGGRKFHGSWFSCNNFCFRKEFHSLFISACVPSTTYNIQTLQGNAERWENLVFSCCCWIIRSFDHLIKWETKKRLEMSFGRLATRKIFRFD